MKRKFTLLAAALMLLSCLAIPLGMWGQTPSAGTFIIDFYDANKLTSTSGTGLTNSNYSSFVQVPTGLTVTNVVTSVSVTGTVRYGMNGGLTAGTGTAAGADTHYVTFNIGSDYAVTKCTVYATYYDSPGRWLLNGNAANSGSIGAKGATIANVTDPLIWNNLGGLTALTFKKDNGSGGNQKRLTIYRIVCEYSTGGGTDPSMSVSTNSIDFGSKAINPSEPYTETFNVTFANLEENLIVTGFNGVTVSPTTINHDATSPQTVTVSYSPTAAGSISGNISVNSSEVTEQLVAVTGSAYDPANVDIYERFTGALVEGDYVICGLNSGVAMKNVISSSKFANETVTVSSDDKITNPSASIVWHIAPDGDYWTIYNADVDKYAAGTTSNNQGALIDNVTDYARWDIIYQHSNYTVTCYGRNSSNNKYLRRNGDYGWATYASGTGIAPTFYKKQTNEVIPPSFSASNREIDYNTTSDQIPYTLNNAEGSTGTVSAAVISGDDWLTLPSTTNLSSPVSFTCSANAAAARTATVRLTYTYDNGNESVTKDITITQAGAPMTVTYNANGGTGSAVDKNYVYGSDVTILNYNHGDINFTAPENKVFKNWNTATDGTGTTFAAGATISGINANYTLYAQWEDFPTYTLATSIENGRHYIITNGSNKAMGGQNSNNRAAVAVSIEDVTATVTSTDVYEFVINGPELMPNGNEVYTIYDVNNSGYLYAASNSSNWLRNQSFNDDNGRWIIEFNDGAAEITAQGDNSHCYMRYNSSGSGLFSCYGSGQDDIYLYKKNETTPQYDFYKDIALASNWSTESVGWNFIASPLASNYTPAGNMLANNYDLYQLNNTRWENYKEHEGNNNSGFNLVNGRGYLYANSANVTLHFSGTINTFTTENNANQKGLTTGWNLIGNPYNIPIYINKPYYKMKADGSGIETTDGITSQAIPACTGVVINAGANETVTFSTTAPSGANSNNGNIQMSVAQQATNRGTASTLDKAIVSFNEGSQLEKFYFGTQNANLYIPQGTEEYAIVSSEAQGEMPVSFRANENGQYTLTVNAEGVEMNYLHLIDNMTGADIDLLQTPSYTFNAKTTDYESRFRLVFAANNEDGSSTGSETFSFYSNGSWVISNEGEATLQVIDALGRILSSETVNGSVSKNINAPAGVYVLRLINGDSVRTQKIVVR